MDRIEEIKQRLKSGIRLKSDILFLLARIEDLEKGIEKHRNTVYPKGEPIEHCQDRDLYALIGEKGWGK